MRLCFLLSLLFLIQLSSAQGGEATTIAREWRSTHEQEIIDGFAEFLAIPNVASDAVNIRRNAEHILTLLQPRGFEARLLESPGSPPAVFAERKTEGATRTVMIYAHYDGQPVDPDAWATYPWTPVLRDGPVEKGGKVLPMKAPFNPESRLFARSASDDKAPIAALAAALDALDAAGLPLSVNIKLFLDGEEEAGSPHLAAMLEQHKSLLAADLWLFCDGPVHQSRRPLLAYGVRGAFGFGLTVYGPNRPLHSGHYGNWAPNPIMRLIELISSMRDAEGNILVAGYADEVIPPGILEQEAIAAAPSMDPVLIAELGIGAAESDERLELAVLRPAMNIRGIRSGGVEELASNTIQTSATTSIDLRLVPAQTPDHVRNAVEQHIRNQGYHIVYQAPTEADRASHARVAKLDWRENGYPAYRAPMDSPIARQLAAILNEWSDGALVELPSMGGSLPIYVIDEAVHTPVLMLPIANHDNNQHGNDENIRLQNLWDAIEIYAEVLTGL